MGAGRWDATEWTRYASASGYATRNVHQIYASRRLDADLDPRGPKIRESCDSDDNPESTPLLVALDVTGSMHPVLDAVAKQGLNTLVTEVYQRKPITDPHVLCAAIGDVEAGDSAPLQITQFEADLRIAQQLERLFLEGGGGGNSFESYALAWYFATNFTRCDAFLKRGKKGYLFTVGDEEPTPHLRGADLSRVFGTTIVGDVEAADLLAETQQRWEVFHVIVAEGDYARGRPDRVRNSWRAVLGQRALWLTDHTKLAQVIVSAMQIVEGVDHDAVVNSWDAATADTVVRAIAVGGL